MRARAHRTVDPSREREGSKSGHAPCWVTRRRTETSGRLRERRPDSILDEPLSAVSRPHCSFLTPDDSEWSRRVHAVEHDFYQLPHYAALEAERVGGTARAALASAGEDWILLPLVTRALPQSSEVCDAISPYGYPGVLGQWRNDTAGPLLAALGQSLREHGLCCAFVRLHPLLEAPLEAMRERDTVVEHGQTVWIDLQPSEEEVWAGYRSTTRNIVRQLQRKGFVASEDPALVHYEEFQRIYRATMERVDAASEYYFDAEYFRRLADVLGDRLRLVIVRLGDQIACAGMFVESCGTVQYHLSGVAPDFTRASPARLMLDHAWRAAKTRGARRMHLGGGVGGKADSLFKFKAGFSRHRATFHTWRTVTDEDAYGNAVAQWERSSGRSPTGRAAFFPEYRAP